MQSALRTAAEPSRGGEHKQAMTIEFEIRRTRDGYYWRIVSAKDDRVLAASESHPTKSRCNRDLATVLLGVGRAPVIDVT